MKRGLHFKPNAKRGQERFLLLLISLLLYLGLAPFFLNWVGLRLLLSILLSLVFLSVIYSVSQSRLQGILISLLVLPILITTWLAFGLDSQTMQAIAHILSIIFFAGAIVMILGFVMRAQAVTLNVIYAAIVVYLFIGITWSIMYSLLEIAVPGSFNNISTAVDDGAYEFIYFSMVTLTTLGYGDISPLTQQGRALVVIEAVVGQFYIAILIARLVGTYISDQDQK